MISVKDGTGFFKREADGTTMKARGRQYEKFDIPNRGGTIRCELYQANSNKAVICIGGVGGGTHGPANIYHPLGERLLDADISTLLIDCRFNSDLNECISDMLLCIERLDKEYHMDRIGLVGWSFGGAVVISVAADDPRVKAVVTVASQCFGTQGVSRMKASILLIHGTGDSTLPYECSEDIHGRAQGQKRLLLFPGADHGVSQHRDEMFKMVREWLTEHL